MEILFGLAICLLLFSILVALGWVIQLMRALLEQLEKLQEDTSTPALAPYFSRATPSPQPGALSKALAPPSSRRGR